MTIGWVRLQWLHWPGGWWRDLQLLSHFPAAHGAAGGICRWVYSNRSPSPGHSSCLPIYKPGHRHKGLTCAFGLLWDSLSAFTALGNDFSLPTLYCLLMRTLELPRKWSLPYLWTASRAEGHSPVSSTLQGIIMLESLMCYHSGLGQLPAVPSLTNQG